MIEKWCDLNGPLMRFRAAEDALLAPAWEGWALAETGPRDKADFTLDIACAPFSAAPGDAPLLFDGVAPPNLRCVVRQIGSSEHYAIDGRASLLLGERQGLLQVAPGEEKLARSSIAFQAIGAALALDDQVVLHAAVLAPPESDSAILVFGPSGFGKTTTTLSLVAAGWRLLSDDVSVTKRVVGADRVWGLPLSLKVHRKTATLLPWLQPLLKGQWNQQQEQSLAFAELYKFLDVVPRPQAPQSISAIIVLAERNGDCHRIRVLAKSEAFVAIVRDNLSRNLQGIGVRQQARVRRIVELLRSTPTYELSAGPDPESLPSALLRGPIPLSR